MSQKRIKVKKLQTTKYVIILLIKCLYNLFSFFKMHKNNNFKYQFDKQLCCKCF